MSTTARAILFTQCLQSDFVKPIGPFDELPNRLHVGADESRRLLGERPAEGPVARTMEWAYARTPDELRIIHILDSHSEQDTSQQAHLRQFGAHCLEGTAGARLAFEAPGASDNPPLSVLSPTLNDFHNTNLSALLTPYADVPVKAGIMGVWTEAKVYFLAYELQSRYPHMELAVCSALCASSSRGHHFAAIDQIRRILGIRICDSVGEFIEFLGGSATDFPLSGLHRQYPAVNLQQAPPLADTDDQLLRYLFRHCRGVSARVLDGGFSGNVVLGTESVDLHGHEEVPHVVKIGPRDAMSRERLAFERIEEVLGNSAPRISDFADFGGRGAVKYRYASMLKGGVSTFQKRYCAGMPMHTVRQVLTTVFEEQLGRLYTAAEPESCDLLSYYCFDSCWAGSVRQRVEELLGGPAGGETLRLGGRLTVPNLCLFYERFLDTVSPLRRDSVYFSFVHGDLNGANIIIDSHENVWLIDFFHTHRGHVLKDLIKLENDLLYIFTPIPDESVLAEACALSDRLLGVADLAAPLPTRDNSGIRSPQLLRAWDTVSILRGFYPPLIRTSRSPFQWLVGAMRYAVHSLSFDECSTLQKKWALYTASRCGERIARAIEGREVLRIDHVDPCHVSPGKLGMTILPGRRDMPRDLERDLGSMKKAGVDAVVCLVPDEELHEYGVPDLLRRYGEQGIESYHLPILDQKACAPEQMDAALDWVGERLVSGAHVVVHCAGGLGRSGMAVACYLRRRGLSADEALAEVRRARGPRAVESEIQERFVRDCR